MSTDAILGICITTVICVMVICLCISSCYNSKHGYEYDKYKLYFDNNDTSYWRTTTFTIPTDKLDNDGYIKLLESLITGMDNGNFTNVRLDDKEVTVDVLKDLIKEMNSTDKNNTNT